MSFKNPDKLKKKKTAVKKASAQPTTVSEAVAASKKPKTK